MSYVTRRGDGAVGGDGLRAGALRADVDSDDQFLLHRGSLASFARSASVDAHLERIREVMFERDEHDFTEDRAVDLEEGEKQRAGGHPKALGGLALGDGGRDRGNAVVDSDPLGVKRVV